MKTRRSTERLASLEFVYPLKKEYGGFFAVHLRDYFAGLVDALAEALELTEIAGVPVQISHLQAVGKGNWGKAEPLLGMVDGARGRGVDAMIDS
jgi:N-acyl-D-amino-acid deacylase